MRDLNKFTGSGRFTADPEVRYSAGDNPLAIGRFTLAMNRTPKKGEEAQADYINCVCFGNTATHVEKYYHKGTKALIEGRIQTGSYTNKDGQKVYYTEILVEDIGFAESKRDDSSEASSSQKAGTQSGTAGGFMNIPDGIEDEMPWR